MIEIRAATPADLDAIDAIEQHSFARPWPRTTFEAELTREWAHVDVLLLDGTIVAFCDYWVVPPEMQILAIATSPDHRGRGLGGEMLAHVLAQSAALGCQIASLEVRAGNAPAIALYERHGFRTVHVRARYYQDDGEDALVMTRGLATE
ncbi:MAG: ribosomal protein S18-alanine N-acetyltransferase [Deltaproteobacteria bacterium]|nr:ribosomal protein S18-alanine N-acetyltransferase [Deltaproteobacteria bacterium]